MRGRIHNTLDPNDIICPLPGLASLRRQEPGRTLKFHSFKERLDNHDYLGLEAHPASRYTRNSHLLHAVTKPIPCGAQSSKEGGQQRPGSLTCGFLLPICGLKISA